MNDRQELWHHQICILRQIGALFFFLRNILISGQSKMAKNFKAWIGFFWYYILLLSTLLGIMTQDPILSTYFHGFGPCNLEFLKAIFCRFILTLVHLLWPASNCEISRENCLCCKALNGLVVSENYTNQFFK